MSKHTPGPWAFGFGNGVSGPRAAPSCFWDGEDIQEFPIRSGDEVVAWVATTRLDGMEESDARLIAAAPDLLSLLKEISENSTAFNSAIEMDFEMDGESWMGRVKETISKIESPQC